MLRRRCAGPRLKGAMIGAWAVSMTAALVTVALADPAATEDAAWLALPAAADPALRSRPLEARGRDVYERRCVACHGPIPDEIFGAPFLPVMPGTQALAARYRGEIPAVLDERTDLSPDLVAAVVRGGLRSMPFFRPTEVSDDDLEALIAYLTRERD
jgi:(+)-pinoresinol hydroxylase